MYAEFVSLFTSYTNFDEWVIIIYMLHFGLNLSESSEIIINHEWERKRDVLVIHIINNTLCNVIYKLFNLFL